MLATAIAVVNVSAICLLNKLVSADEKSASAESKKKDSKIQEVFEIMMKFINKINIFT